MASLYRTKNKTPGYNEKLGVAPGVDSSWVKANALNALSAISQDLPPVAQGTKLHMDDISIPSPWAKFVSFESVLFGGKEEYGALFEQALADWRCLLTLIALGEIIGMNVVVDEPIDLNVAANSAEEKLFKNLKLLTPGNYIFRDSVCWNKISPIVLRERLREFNIGMLSNSTIVCPPYHFDSETQVLLATKPFFVNGNFIDPVPYIQSDDRRKYAMYVWLTKLIDYCKLNLPQSVVLGTVISLLEQFSFEIGTPAVEDKCINVSIPQIEMPGIYELMSNVKLNYTPVETACKLQVETKGTEKLILVDDSILGINANSDIADGISIIGAKTLKQKGAFQSGERMYAGQAIPDDTEIYIASDLLYDKLAVIEAGSGSIVSENADIVDYNTLNNRDIIWPINDVLFKYMAASEIKERLKVTKISTTEYEVKLTLKLLAGDIEICKKYNQEDMIVIPETMVPYLSIWPYVKVNKEGNPENLWKKYYTYCASTKDTVPFAVCTEKGESATAYGLNCISDEYFTRNRYIYPSIPTHVKIFDKNNPSKSIGSILFTSPKKCDIQTHTKWTVGFDFGTTSTTAFYTEAHGKTSFVQFGTEYKVVRNTATQKDEKSIVNDVDEGLYVAMNPIIFRQDKAQFVPDLYLQRNAYPTIYEQQSSNFDSSAPEAFVKGHSLYSYENTGNDLTKVYTDLKWSSDPDVKAAARNYVYQVLSQVVYAAAIKNVGEITWKLSYPTALSRALLEGYKNMTKNIIKLLEQESGIKCNIDDGHTFYTESIAAAEYFGSQAEAGLFVCVDIGGGSTDISIWKRGIETANLLQTSINLASRAIFLPSITKLIAEDANIRNSVVALKGDIEKELQENQGVITDKLRMAIEGILFEFENRVQDIVSNFESVHKTSFQRSISVGFVSLLYYAMNAIAYVKDQITDANSLTVCLGGNGSKLYNWFPDYYKNELKVCLREYLSKLIGRDIVIDVQYNSANLKTEAARGLLNIVGNEYDFLRNTVTLMGEKATVKFKDGSVKEFVATDNIYDNEAMKKFYEVKGNQSSLTNPDDIAEIKIDGDMTSIKEFIALCNKVHLVYDDQAMKLEYSEEDWVKIYEKIKLDHANEIREGIMSPAFALGVKAILSKENGGSKR